MGNDLLVTCYVQGNIAKSWQLSLGGGGGKSQISRGGKSQMSLTCEFVKPIWVLHKAVREFHKAGSAPVRHCRVHHVDRPVNWGGLKIQRGLQGGHSVLVKKKSCRAVLSLFQHSEKFPKKLKNCPKSPWSQGGGEASAWVDPSAMENVVFEIRFSQCSVRHFMFYSPVFCMIPVGDITPAFQYLCFQNCQNYTKKQASLEKPPISQKKKNSFQQTR